MLIYLFIFNFLWRYLPIDKSLMVLVGTIFVLLSSLMFAVLSTNKLIDFIQSKRII